MIIYKVTNLTNGKIYIGQTVSSLPIRRAAHFYGAKVPKTVFHKALRKYGKKNFRWDIIDFAKTLEELNDKEVLYIRGYQSYAFLNKGYNTELGGRNSRSSTETKRKMSAIKQQNRYKEIARQNLPESTAGRNNGRFKEVNLDNLAQDFSQNFLTYKELKNKYHISRPTVLRKLRIYFGDIFDKIQEERENKLEAQGAYYRK